MKSNEPKIKFYKYFFSNNEKPVIMEAYSKEEADSMLNELNLKTNSIDMAKLIDVRIEMPLKGISTRKRHGKTFVWVGLEYSVDGWMDEVDFKD